MANILNYIDKYKDVTFEQEEFNELDNLVLCSITYLNYKKEYINEVKRSLEFVGKHFLNYNSYRDVKKLGIPQRDAYKVLEKIVETNRYKDIIVGDYVYEENKDMQFCAITYKISKKLKFICFEGTDDLISGWKEDCHLACFFPVPSHTKAIEYVNKHTNLFKENVIIGGHSKGGNLALVAGMYLKKYKQHKLIKIYSNDGPGLRKKEFESKEYERIKDKYIHFVPETSVVGVLLRNDVYNVIKTSKKLIMAHAIASWKVDDKRLIEGQLSDSSKYLERNIISWLDNHNDIQREKLINNTFRAIEDSNIKSFTQFNDLDKVIKVMKNLANIDNETKNLIMDLLKFSFNNMIKEEV